MPPDRLHRWRPSPQFRVRDRLVDRGLLQSARKNLERQRIIVHASRCPPRCRCSFGYHQLEQLKALVVQLLNRVAEQERLIAELRDENARLKGLNGRPRMKPSGMEPASEPKPPGKRGKRRRRGKITPRVRERISYLYRASLLIINSCVVGSYVELPDFDAGFAWRPANSSSGDST